MTLTPAYGRDYNSKAAVIADFKAGKDFEANSPTASGKCSILDFPAGTQLNLRYRKLTMAVSYTVSVDDKPKSTCT